MSWMKVLLLLGFVAMLGCSDAEKLTDAEPPVKERLKSALEGIAESGQGGSEIGALMNDLEELRKTDPDIATQLVDDATAMMSVGPDQIKAKAQEMLQKLEKAKGG